MSLHDAHPPSLYVVVFVARNDLLRACRVGDEAAAYLGGGLRLLRNSVSGFRFLGSDGENFLDEGVESTRVRSGLVRDKLRGVAFDLFRPVLRCHSQGFADEVAPSLHVALLAAVRVEVCDLHAECDPLWCGGAL